MLLIAKKILGFSSFSLRHMPIYRLPYQFTVDIIQKQQEVIVRFYIRNSLKPTVPSYLFIYLFFFFSYSKYNVGEDYKNDVQVITYLITN